MEAENWVDRVLALPTLDEQIALLDGAGLLNADGIGQLAVVPSNHSPDVMAGWLGTLTAIARTANIPAIIPTLQYKHAHFATLMADWQTAQTLIEAAHDNYLEQDQPLAAAQTTVGLAMVLGQTGQYAVALNRLDEQLAQLNRSDAAEIIAKLHHNRAVCHSQLGEFDSAIADFLLAETGYQSVGATRALQDVIASRGVLLLRMGRGVEAEQLFAESLDQWQDARMRGMALGNLGYARSLTGDYSRSLANLQEAFELQESAGVPLYAQRKRLDLGELYVTLNLNEDAIEVYREACAALRSAEMIFELARGLWGWGVALAANENRVEAIEKLLESADLCAQIGNLPLQATVLLSLAGVHEATGALDRASVTSEQAEQLIDERNAPLQQLFVALYRAHLSLELEDLPLAENYLNVAQTLLTELNVPTLRYRVNYGWGRLRRLQGRGDESADYLNTALDDIEQLRGKLVQEALRTHFLDDKIAVYEQLIALHLDNNDFNAAFAIAERAKSRTLIDLMLGALDPDTVADSESADLRANLNALYNELLGNGDQRGRRTYRTITTQAHEIERQLCQRDTPFSTLDRDPFRIEMPTVVPQTNMLMVAYHIVEGKIVAFVGKGEQMEAGRVVTAVKHVKPLLDRLFVQWRRLRADHTFAPRHLAQMERATVRILQQLYDQLVAPIRALLRDERIVIIPHGLLHRVPFHALHDGEHYLIDAYEFSYAPNLTAFVLCQARQPVGKDRVSIFGVSDPHLHEVKHEVAAVAQFYGDAECFRDETALIGRFRASAHTSDILHIACHGIYRADNALFSAIKLHDGWLTAHELSNLRFPHSLLMLSACESGVSQITRGDELLGLTRACLGAGVATLVVSQWLIDDTVAAQFVPTFYKNLQTMPPASALRQMQLACRDSYSHPFFWAPFIVVGKR